MILVSTLLAGAAITALASVIALFAAPYVAPLSYALAAGQLLVAIGVWSLKEIIGMDRMGRAGIVLTSFGYGAFATTTLLATSAGIATDIEIARTPFFLMSATFLIPGLAALAWFTVRRESLLAGLPALIALFAGGSLLTLLRPFLNDIAPVHAAAGIIGAVALLWAGWIRFNAGKR